jgi:hypothetical protein
MRLLAVLMAVDRGQARTENESLQRICDELMGLLEQQKAGGGGGGA